MKAPTQKLTFTTFVPRAEHFAELRAAEVEEDACSMRLDMARQELAAAEDAACEASERKRALRRAVGQ